MMLYADLPVRRAWQVAGDLFVVLWTWLWIDVAHAVRDATLRLADPGRRIDSSASDLAGRLRDAGDSGARLPLVGADGSSPARPRDSPAPGASRSRPWSRWPTGWA